MDSAAITKITGVLAALGYECTAKQAEKLNAYFRFLVEYNAKVNLTAITDEDEVIVKHFADSLGGVRFIPSGAKLIDVGSGAGFPAVVIKIFREDVDVTLLEPNGKKSKFLSELIALLGLSDIRVIADRAEVVARGALRESFDVVTARAVAELNKLAEYCLPLVKTGGKFIAYKGKAREETERALSAITKLGGGEPGLCEYPLFDNVRTAVVVAKVRPTPAEYPRQNNKITAKPL